MNNENDKKYIWNKYLTYCRDLINNNKLKKSDNIKYSLIKTSFGYDVERTNIKDNSKRLISLIDLENVNNGDLFIIDNDTYFIFGEKLYGITNDLILDASAFLPFLYESKIEHMTYKEYIYSKEYYSSAHGWLNDKGYIMYKTFKVAYDQVLFDDEFLGEDKNEIENSLTEADSRVGAEYIFEFDDVFDVFRNPEMHKPNPTPDNYMKYLGSFYGYRNFNDAISFKDEDNCISYIELTQDDKKNPIYSKYINEYNQEEAEFEKDLEEYILNNNLDDENIEDDNYDDSHARTLAERYNNAKEKYNNINLSEENVRDNILKNGKVNKQIKTAITILKNYLYKKIEIYDYSFIIINFVKAAELFMTYKLSKLKNKNIILNETLKNQFVMDQNGSIKYIYRDLTSDTFKHNSMIGFMINILQLNKNTIIKKDFDEHKINNFMESLSDWKNYGRNGFFHKHSIDSLDEARKIINMTLKLMVRLELYLDVE